MKRIFVVFLLICSIFVNGEKILKLERSDNIGKDATEILQKAIDSKASIVIVGKKGSPWLTKPLTLRSDQEIVIEKGAVLKAMPGEFKHLNDCLLNAIGCKNIVIRGPGTLLMNKKDYQDTKRYKHSEWRHAINLRSCENVLIENLRIIGSGGDGIYVGSRPGLKAWRGTRYHGVEYAKLPNYCKNVTVKNCFIDDNHRQGISVISVENLLVSNTQMNNTDGTAPMAGIDFEPNRGDERLVNCIVENCIMDSNKAYGFVIYSKINKAAKPISLTLKNCLIKGGGRGAVVSMNPKEDNPAGGFVKFVNCRIENTSDCGIELRSLYSNGWKVIFENCIVENTSLRQPGRSPVIISLSPNSTYNTGNVEFKNCTVMDKMKRPLMQLNNLAGKLVVEKVSGNINYNGKNIDMAKYIKANKMDVPNVLAIAPLELKELFPVDGYVLQKIRKTQPRLIFRRKTRFLIASEKDKTVKFNFKYDRISRRVRQTVMKVYLTSPSGKATKLKDAVLNKNNSYSFTATEKGVYKISCNPGGQKLQIKDCNSPFSVAMPEKGMLALYRPQGRIYFGIPAEVKEFSIQISGENAETVSGKIYIGKKLVASADHISAPKVFSIKCKPAKKTRVASIVLTNAVEDARVKLPVPLLPLFAADKSELMVTTNKVAP